MDDKMNIMLTDIRSLTLDMQEIPVVEQGVGDSFTRLLRQQFPTDAENGVQAIEIKDFFEGAAGSGQSPEITPSSVPSASWQDYLSQQQIRITTDTDPVEATQVDLSATLLQPVAVDGGQAMVITGQQLPVGGKSLPDGSVIAAEIPRRGISPAELRLDVSAAVDSRPASAVDSALKPFLQPLPMEADVLTKATAGGKTNAAELSPQPVESSPGRLAAGLTSSDPRLVSEIPVSIDRVKISEPTVAVKIPESATVVANTRSDTHSDEVTNRELLGDRRVDAHASGANAGREPTTRELPLPRLLSTIGEISPREAPLNNPGAPQREVSHSGEIPAGLDLRDANRAPLQPLNSNADAVAGEFAGNRSAELPAQVTTNHAQQTISALSASGSAQPAVSTLATPVVTQNVLPPQLETLSLARSADAPEWSEGLGERVSWMINQKQNSASIRLDPPMLGKLDVQVKIADDATTITIQTQHAQTRDLIESASLRLREFLQESGYQNVNVDVSQRQDQQQARAQSTAEEQQGDAEETDPESMPQQQQQSRFFSGDGLLDTFA